MRRAGEAGAIGCKQQDVVIARFTKIERLGAAGVGVAGRFLRLQAKLVVMAEAWRSAMLVRPGSTLSVATRLSRIAGPRWPAPQSVTLSESSTGSQDIVWKTCTLAGQSRRQ